MIYPKQYGPEEISWLENVFEPMYRQETRNNSITSNYIDHTVDPDDVERDDGNTDLFYDCRLDELGGKRLNVLYHVKSDFSEAAKILRTKESTLRSWIYRLRLGLELTGSSRKQVSRMLCIPCDE